MKKKEPAPSPSVESAPMTDEERKQQDAREIIVKHALWDAGFCGEQSAERGPVMLKAFELVEDAVREGRRLEREAWERFDNLRLDMAQSRIATLERELSSLRSELAEAKTQLEAATGVDWKSDYVTVSKERDAARAEAEKYKAALENMPCHCCYGGKTGREFFECSRCAALASGKGEK